MTAHLRNGIAVGLTTLGLLATPTAAQAAYCPIGGSGVTYNQAGEAAKFSSLRPLSGMNCPSARYVMNRWLRATFARSYSNRLPTRFWDGYVTWHCGRVSRRKWRCDEYDSDTSFRFTAYML